MQIIKEQFGRLNHFLIIMIPLFTVNALFNLKYDWGGVSVIARVYIMVLSFYVIFIFSQINVDDYRSDYTARHGWKGKYLLFIVLRLFPFLFIYLLTAIFTLINYLDNPNWPIEPIFRLLDGRYSNTVIYPLILFIVLKQKKRPGISIPLFIVLSFLYYGADSTLYSIFEPGFGVMIIKFVKYFIFIFVLVFDYHKSKWVLIKSVIFSLFVGSLLFISVASIVAGSFFLSSPGSASLSVTGRILIKAGFVLPLNKFQKNVLEYGNPNNTRDVFIFIEKYGVQNDYTPRELEKIISRNNIFSIGYIFRYLNKRNITLDFKMLKGYAVSQLENVPSYSSGLDEFSKHFGSYYTDNKKEFFELYKSGNDLMKVTVLNSLAYTDDIDAVNFLIDKLTSIDRLLSDAAYNSLRTISGKDPSANLKKAKYDIEVVLYFRDYASRMKK